MPSGWLVASSVLGQTPIATATRFHALSFGRIYSLLPAIMRVGLPEKRQEEVLPVVYSHAPDGSRQGGSVRYFPQQLIRRKPIANHTRCVRTYRGCSDAQARARACAPVRSATWSPGRARWTRRNWYRFETLLDYIYYHYLLVFGCRRKLQYLLLVCRCFVS